MHKCTQIDFAPLPERPQEDEEEEEEELKAPTPPGKPCIPSIRKVPKGEMGGYASLIGLKDEQGQSRASTFLHPLH